MLDLAIIRRNNQEPPFSVPHLLDAMLFYGHVHLILDRHSVLSIMDQIGARQLKTLLNFPTVSAEITAEFTGVMSQDGAPFRRHRPGFYTISPKRGDSQLDIFYEMMRRTKFEPTPSRELVSRILNSAKRSNYDKILRGENGYYDLFFSLATDLDTIKLTISQIANTRGVNVNADQLQLLKIESIRSNEFISYRSSVPIDTIIPKSFDNEDVWSCVLASIHDYALDMQLSQIHSADILLSPATSELSTKRMDLSLMRGSKSKDSIESFSDFVLDGGGLLSVAFESGRIDFDEALRIIDKTRKFRDWVNDLPPNADLVSEYHKEIARESALGTLPAKALRYSVITGGGLLAGAISTEMGLAASASLGLFDTFVLDNLMRGWRPNAFVRTLRKKIA